MYKIAKEHLSELFQKIAESQELYLPVKNAGQTNFSAWTEDAEVDLETLKTVKSPKDAFFPQSENLYTVKQEGKKLRVEPEALKSQNFVVFGMKACDLKGVEVLDRVFLSEPIDTFYAARRDHGTIVALACHEPEESCFCKVFGIDAANPAADVTTWMIEGELYWNALTEKGEALTASCKRNSCRCRGRKSRGRKRSDSRNRGKASIYEPFVRWLGRRCADRKIRLPTLGRTI